MADATLSAAGGKREFYVYVLSRPDSRPCYVGKGKNRRMEGNIRKSHNPYLARIINLAGGSIPCRKVVENVTEDEAFELECFLIKEIGRIPHGPLVNGTNGGDGVVGHIRTAEQRARMSIARRGRVVPEEQRRRQSETMKGCTFSDEHKAAISAAKKGKSTGPLSALHIEAIASANRGKKRTGTALEAIRQAHANMSDEARALKSQRVSAALTGKPLTESHRATISRIQKGRVRSQEFKDKVGAGLRVFHNNTERDARIMQMTEQGLTAMQIGEQVGISEAAVWSAQHRARQQIARMK
jgi:hypothetical protein